MKAITRFSVLCLLALATTTAWATQITGVTVSADFGGGVESIELPSQGLPIQDLSEGGTYGEKKFAIDGFTAVVDGTATQVNFVGAVYKAIQTSQDHWRTIPGSEMSATTWGVSGLNADLLEDLDEGTVYIFEFYIEGADKSGSTFYYNNGGANYKIKFMKAGDSQSSDPVTYLAAAMTLTRDGETLNYGYYNGEYKGDGNDLGTVSALAINGMSVAVSTANGVDVKDFSLQYKVYPVNGDGGWNRVDPTESIQVTDGYTGWIYAGEEMNVNLLNGCTPGEDYVMEVMLQAIATDGHYYFLGRDDERMRFTFTMGESASDDPEIVSLIIDAIVNGEESGGYLEHEGQEDFDLGEVEELKLMKVSAWLINDESVESVWMDYCVLPDGTIPQSSDWQQINLINMHSYDGEWSNDTRHDLLTGLDNGKKYTLMFFVNGNTENGQIHYDNGGRGYRVLFTCKAGETGLPGDVDGNNVVNGSDVTALYNFLLNGASTGGNADVDGNGTVNGSDVTALYNLLLK